MSSVTVSLESPRPHDPRPLLVYHDPEMLVASPTLPSCPHTTALADARRAQEKGDIT